MTSYFRKEKRGAREIESNTNEEEVATKCRSSRLFFLNVKANDVLDLSSECMDVSEDGPGFLDNG